MICKNCREMIPDDSVFCPSCGQKVEAEPVMASPPIFSSAFRQAGNLDGGDSGIGVPVVERKSVAPERDSGLRISSSFKSTDNAPVNAPTDEIVITPVEPKKENGAKVVDRSIQKHCADCGGVLDTDARFCNNCGKRLGEPLGQKVWGKLTFGVKKLLKLKNATGTSKKGIVIAAGFAAVLAVVLLAGVATDWFGATGPAARVASAVKNTLTAKNFSVDFEYTYNEYREYTDETRGTAYIALNPEDRELTVYAELTVDGESGVFAIYDGYYIVSSNHGCLGYDISKQLDAYFDAYEEGMSKNGTWEELFDKLFPHARQNVIDFNILDECITQYTKKLNSQKWLEENAGYSVEKSSGITKYSLSPDIYGFLKASFTQFEDAFVRSSDYNDLYEELRDLRFGSKHTDTEIVFGVKSGKLTEFSFDISGSYEGLICGDEMHIEANFYDVGKTEFNIDELEDMLAEAKENRY